MLAQCLARSFCAGALLATVTGISSCSYVRRSGVEAEPRSTKRSVEEKNLRSVWEGAYTPAQAKRGRQAYATKCVACHNLNPEPESDPDLVGPAMRQRWRDKELAQFFDLIQTTMPTDAPASLPPEVYADIVSYLLEVNGYPAGNAELTPDHKMLESIFFRFQSE